MTEVPIIKALETASDQTAPLNSWTNIVQNKKILEKYELQVKIKDGIGSVSIPTDVYMDPSTIWEDFLIGRFLDTAPHVAKVHAIVNKIWALGEKSQMIDVFVINKTTMKFRIGNDKKRERLLKRGMWNLAGVPVVLSKWSPLTEDATPDVKSVPLWVHLKKVPTSMYSWKGLGFISSAVGDPVRLHTDTCDECDPISGSGGRYKLIFDFP